jgi:5S rRNA maturation endonuclease (ribonuclease M5)
MAKTSEEIKEILADIYVLIENEKNALVIVEGKKDAAALKAVGFRRIITLNKPLYEIAESITEKRILILTDLDKKGKEIYSKLKRDLCKRGVVVDDALRNLLFKTELRQIEGLTHYLKRFE